MGSERVYNAFGWVQQTIIDDDATVDKDEVEQLREAPDCDVPDLSASERSKLVSALRKYYTSSWSWQLSEVPILILYGENEPFIEPHVEYLGTRLADCRTAEIPGANHDAQVGNPEFIRTRVREFLDDAVDERKGGYELVVTTDRAE